MIEINNLQKEYRDFKLNVSLEVKDGQITGVVGRNGAGKSTIIKAILNMIDIDQGKITILGKPADKLDKNDRQQIGVVLSDSGFSNYLTVKSIKKVLKNLYQDFDEEFFDQKVDKYQLPTDKIIKEFSTGMRVKLHVLAALSHDSKLLILDEPTSGLDVVARNEVLDMLREYMNSNVDKAILITSHISSDLECLCDDIYMIDKGKIILHEDTDVLLSEYGLIKVNKEQYIKLDKQYIIKDKEVNFGYECLTNNKQFYLSDNSDIIVENIGIDEAIVMLSDN